MTPDDILTPLPDDDWPPSADDLLSGFAGGLNVYRTMAHHPELLRAWTNLREHLVNNTALGPQLAEIVILRAGYRLGSDYEWFQHVRRARKCGLTDARISTIRGPVDAMARDDAVLVRAVDELLDQSGLSALTRKNVFRLVGAQGVLDLMATVGFYSTLGFILNSFEVALDNDAAEDLAANPLE